MPFNGSPRTIATDRKERKNDVPNETSKFIQTAYLYQRDQRSSNCSSLYVDFFAPGGVLPHGNRFARSGHASAP